MGYIVAGIFIVPFHGDESDHLYQARDYASYFVLLRPGTLRVDPPVAIDSEAHKRLLAGTLSAYLTGFILWHSGYQDLQNWQPAWYYPDDVSANRAAGRYPPPRVLWWGRLGSALLLAGCIGLLVRLGAHVGYPLGGLMAALLFALHPVILLNGRRVMQEGALLFCTLLFIHAVLWFYQHPRWGTGLLMGIAAGLLLASKPTGIIAEVAPLFVPSRRLWIRPIGLVVAVACLLYLLLTPAVWSNPLARVWLAAQLRADVLRGQTLASEQAHGALHRRFAALLTQPFPGEIQYYESPDFAADPITRQQIATYEESPLKGLMLPAPLGLGLALLGGVGLARQRRGAARVVLAWVLVTGVAIGLAVPLAWQRYYLPWTLCVMFMAGLGLDILRQKGQAYLLVRRQNAHLV